MITFYFAFATFALTAFLVLGNLKSVARDTFQALNNSTLRARASGGLPPRLAFAVLWVLIFALSSM